MSENSANSYDDLPYGGVPFPQTHPDRLAVMARLFGVAAPDVATSRVLELGCAGGENLIPLAVAMPNARFVGLDLSHRQIEMGNQVVSAIGLTNIELAQRDIADVSAAEGSFDYIIAHGLYSWIPAPVRDKVLAICRDHLTPNGIAYISYKTFPGWSVPLVLRDMIRLFAMGNAGVHAQLAAARGVLQALGTDLEIDSAYRAQLREHIDYLGEVRDSYLYHEHLEQTSVPFYFHEFVADAHRQGLEFLSEAGLGGMGPGQVSPQAAAALQRVTTDYFGLEQLIDVLVNRSFRQSLLVRADTQVSRRIDATKVFSLGIASPARAQTQQTALISGQPERFDAPNGGTYATANPLMKSALATLIGEWPLGASFDELSARARGRLGLPGSASAAERIGLAEELLRGYAAGVVELRTWTPPVVAKPGLYPTASPLARYQAALDGPLTTLLHTRANVEPYHRMMMPLLDGTRTVDAIQQALAGANQAIPAAPGKRPDAQQYLRRSLELMAKVGLLSA